MEVAVDFYATLGVEPRADDATIRLAYRKLMRCYHPDVNASDEASARAKAINEAYACLHDPMKRAAYDGARRARQREWQSRAPMAPLHDYRPSWRNLNVDKVNEEPPLLRRWKLVAFGLAAIVTVITFTMTSSVDTGAPAPSDTSFGSAR
jgi:curved DNA-binding protein CbpA